jgi:hypothetical protein
VLKHHSLFHPRDNQENSTQQSVRWLKNQPCQSGSRRVINIHTSPKLLNSINHLLGLHFQSLINYKDKKKKEGKLRDVFQEDVQLKTVEKKSRLIDSTWLRASVFFFFLSLQRMYMISKQNPNKGPERDQMNIYIEIKGGKWKRRSNLVKKNI